MNLDRCYVVQSIALPLSLLGTMDFINERFCDRKRTRRLDQWTLSWKFLTLICELVVGCDIMKDRVSVRENLIGLVSERFKGVSAFVACV